MALNYEHDPDRVKMNHVTKYLHTHTADRLHYADAKMVGNYHTW